MVWAPGRKTLLCGSGRVFGSTATDIWIQFAGSARRHAWLCQLGISLLWFQLPWSALIVIPHYLVKGGGMNHKLLQSNDISWSSPTSLPCSFQLIRAMNLVHGQSANISCVFEGGALRSSEIPVMSVGRGCSCSSTDDSSVQLEQGELLSEMSVDESLCSNWALTAAIAGITANKSSMFSMAV